MLSPHRLREYTLRLLLSRIKVLGLGSGSLYPWLSMAHYSLGAVQWPPSVGLALGHLSDVATGNVALQVISSRQEIGQGAKLIANATQLALHR